MLCCQTWTAAACPPWLQVTCSCATFAAQQEQMWSSVAGAQANMKGVLQGLALSLTHSAISSQACRLRNHTEAAPACTA